MSDHKAKAIELVEYANWVPAGAQAHATIALVEAQEMANQIAFLALLSQKGLTGYDNVRRSVSDWAREVGK